MALHNYAFFTPVRVAAAVLPRPLLHLLAGVIGRIAFLFMPRARRQVRSNLAAAGSHGGFTDTMKTFTAYARALADHAWLATAPTSRLQHLCRRWEGREVFDEIAGHPRGALIVSAHLGNWELGGALISSMAHGRPVAAVVLRDPGGRIVRFREAMRGRHRIHTIYLNAPEGGGSFQILNFLKNRGWIMMLTERNYTRTGVTVDFLGKEWFFPDGPARIALAVNVPLVPAYCLLNADGSYTGRLDRPLHPDGETTQSLSRQLAGRLESMIRAHPHQWFNFVPNPRPQRT